jgi:hypothetical protein
MVTEADPADVEFEMLAAFRSAHDGRLPFANLNKGRRPR